MPMLGAKDVMALSNPEPPVKISCGDSATNLVHGKQSKWRTKELALRIASSLLLIPLCLVALFYGGLFFQALIGIVGALALCEFLRMVHLSPFVNAFFSLMIGAGAILFQTEGLPWVAVLYAGISLCLGIVLPTKVAKLYGMMLPLSVWSLFHIPFMNHNLAIALLVVVWSTDIGAYFTGRALGGVKLCPAVSPNKTLSGACGGLIAALILGGVTLKLGHHPFGISEALLIMVTSAVSQAGDLWESFFKRQYHVKDSGTLIPGHGGVLDRVDGLVTAAICWYGMMSMGWI